MAAQSEIERRLAQVHKGVLQATAPICIALVRRQVRPRELVEAVEQLKSMTMLLEETIGLAVGTGHAGRSSSSKGQGEA